MKETTCIVTASLTKGMELLSHCYHIFHTEGHNEDKEECINNDMHMKKHSDWLMDNDKHSDWLMDSDKYFDWLMDNDIIMMGSNWLINNDMHMKKHSDWLTYMVLWGS